MSNDEIIIIGKLGAAFGVYGWLRVHSFTRPKENIVQYDPWLIKLNNQWVEVTIAEAELHAKGLIIKLPNCDDREVAKRYTNAEIAIYRDQLPALPENEFYWTDLEGLTVINQAQVELGKVTRLFDTGASDVLEVQGKKQYLIPYLSGKTVLEVDLEQQVIRVDWGEDF